MRKILIATLLALSPMTWAADIVIPHEFEFVSINGEPVRGSMLSHNSKQKLQSGANKIALYYQQLVRVDYGKDQTKVKSAPFIISFSADADKDYRLKQIGKITTRKQAEVFANDPQVILINSDGNEVEFALETSEQTERGLFTHLIRDPNHSNKIAKDTANLSSIATQTDSAYAQANTEVELMMHYWWQRADAESRAEFGSWAVTHLTSTELDQSMDCTNRAQSMLQYWFIEAEKPVRKAFLATAIQSL